MKVSLLLLVHGCRVLGCGTVASPLTCHCPLASHFGSGEQDAVLLAAQGTGPGVHYVH